MVCHANSTPPSSSPTNSISTNQNAAALYDQGFAASNNNDYKGALSLFMEALKDDPNNPDILNMVAHTQRKLGDINDALANYQKALELRPNFPVAREYLGEAYIQAATGEIATLKSYGDNGKEQADDLIKSLKDAAAKS